MPTLASVAFRDTYKNAFAASGVKRANDGAGMAGEMALAVEVGARVGSGDSGSERAAKRQARLEEVRRKWRSAFPPVRRRLA